jgi:hypothetical protein
MMDYTPRCLVVCKWTDSPTMDSPDVCLKAFWLQEWEWVLEDCDKRSCWKNSIGVGVPRPCGSDVYVCSKNCRLCLTVVYWLLECNKVTSRIEQPEYVTIIIFRSERTCFASASCRVCYSEVLTFVKFSCRSLPALWSLAGTTATYLCKKDFHGKKNFITCYASCASRFRPACLKTSDVEYSFFMSEG